MTHGSLFSGIGGFDLAADWMGWENKFHCEWNEFGQKVLNYYWPEAESFGDITKTDFKKYNGTIDIISGGFPCQPYSQAGKRKGKEDDRHLWPYMLKAIKDVQPRWVVGENVLGLLNWNGGLVFHEVQTDLEAEGFIVFPYVLPACAKNAPHRRDRVWFVAYSTGNRYNSNTRTKRDNMDREQSENKEQTGHRWTSETCGFSIEQIATNTNGREHIRQKRKRESYGSNSRIGINGWENFPTQSPICSRDDGLSSKLVGITFPKHRNESIKGYGNAIVPQVAYQIFKAIEKYEQLNS